jgi:putative tricarboxylic transport membrane protein
MSDQTQPHAEAGPSQRGVEIGVVVFMAALALIGIFGSLSVGAGWADDGPEAGFFPFYVSLILLLACVINLVSILRHDWARAIFVTWPQSRQVMTVVIPTTIYVFLVPEIGIYIASMLLIAVFMKKLGGYGWAKVIAVSIGVPVFIYLIFENWFLVPLPKGPIEAMLGL